MAKPNENLARSLEVLKAINKNVIKSAELTRTHRERLKNAGFLREVMQGWFIQTSPIEKPGESVCWYANYWEFISRYLEERLGNDYVLSAESSLRSQLGSMIPDQISVVTTRNVNQVIKLPLGSSIAIYRSNITVDAITHNGIRMMPIPAVLTQVPATFFESYPIDAEIALKSIRDPSEVLTYLLNEGKSSVAGRLAGAYRFIGLPEFSDAILSRMMIAGGWKIQEDNPFTTQAPSIKKSRITSPHAERISGLWSTLRDDVLSMKPILNISENRGVETVLAEIDDIYTHDAYNSLSIEGYQVTLELIERVRNGDYDFNKNASDAEQRNAMAAKGYFEAFKLVKQSVSDIIKGEPESKVIASRRHEWFASLFSSAVQAGIIKPSNLAGYRSLPVYIRGSKHVPPHRDHVADCMDALNECMTNEPDNFVRGVLGHFFFVYIHPYMDGNGRTARFMMNCTFASSGLKWTVISEERRAEYFAALECASVHQDIKPFAEFVSSEMQADKRPENAKRRRP